MVNTRAKIKKTKNTLKTCFPQTSITNSDHESTQSGSLIGSNNDLLTEILHRLPVTSILRFKSVSKNWLSRLSQCSFTLLYDNLSKSPGLFVRDLYIPFDVENQNTPPFRSLDFYHDVCGIRIVQSCNGLLLCCSDKGNERSRKYYVFNPTTKQFVVIPLVPGGRDVRKNIRFMGLAFRQTDCVHYKVVCIHFSKLGDEELFRIQIYSSDTRKWRISNQSFVENYFMPFRSGVYWNGAIHWAPSCLNPLYFKLNVQQLQTLPLPMEVASRGGYCDGALPLYFGESRGHLHLVETADQESHLNLNVYEMLGDHSGWFVKYQVELDDLAVAFPEMVHSYQHPSSPHYYEFEVLDVVRGENEEDTFMIVRVPEKIIRYNILNKSFKQIFDLTNISYGRIKYLNVVHRYTEALASF